MKGIGFLDILYSLGGVKLKLVKLFDHVKGGSIAWCLPPRKRSKASLPQGALRILIIRPGGIGDAVFLLPILRELKRAGHEVDILCERRNADVFISQEGLSRNVFRYDIWNEFKDVFRQTYDVAVDTEQWHHLSAIVAYFVKARINIGFATRPSRARLFDVRVDYVLNGYELDNFKDLFESILPGRRYVLAGSYVSQQSLLKDISVPERFSVIALGASIVLRRLTQQQVIAFIGQIHDKGQVAVLVGGKDVSKLAAEILAHPFQGEAIDLTGQTSLPQTAALMSRAGRFFGPDSGLLHLACAVGVPVTAVFGPGNRMKWAPRGAEDEVLFKDIPCAPCTKFGYTIPVCSRRYDCCN